MIAYQENVIAITSSRDHEGPGLVSFEGCYTFLNVKIWERSILDYAAKPLKLPLLDDIHARLQCVELGEQYELGPHDKPHAVREETALPSWLEACATLARFQKFNLFLAHEWRIMLACRKFRSIFANEDVVIAFHKDFGIMYTTHVSKLLLPCRIPRCHSIRFELSQETDVNDTINTITSSDPVYDTYGRYHRMQRDVFNKLKEMDGTTFGSAHYDLVNNLYASACEYDITKY